MSNEIVIILGMHRSGTSAVARAINILGVDLGPELIGAAPDNPKGFWEDQAIVNINERLLARLGTSWDCLVAPRAEQFKDAEFSDLRDEAISLIVSRMESVKCYGFKDPRTCRTLPFWENVFSLLNIQAKYILAFRNPLSVAGSLKSRNGFTFEKSCLLWIEHTLSSLTMTRGFRSIAVDYVNLMADPNYEIQRISSFLGLLDWPEQRVIDEFCLQFIDAKLCHHSLESTVTDPLVNSTELYHQTREIWEGLRESLAASAVDDAVISSEQLETWATNFTASRTAFSFLIDQDLIALKEKLCLQNHLSERDQEITRLNTVVKESSSSIFSLQDNLSERDQEIMRLNTVVKESSSSIFSLRDSLSERDQEIIRLNAVVEESSASIHKAIAELAEHQAELNAREEKVATLEHNIADLEHQNHQKIIELNLLSDKVRYFHGVAERERFTVVKPLFRKLYRFALIGQEYLPGSIRNMLRRIKGRLFPRRVGLELSLEIPFESCLLNTEKQAALNQELFSEVLKSKSDKYDILVFPVIDWHFRIQRPQHLARQMARRGHRVFYFSTTFVKSLEEGVHLLEMPESNVFLCQFACNGSPPRIYEDTLKPYQRDFMLNGFSKFREACAIDQIVSIVDLPFWRQIVERLQSNLMTYDCMDHHAGFSSNTKTMLDEEVLLFKHADLVLTTSARLSEKVAGRVANVVVRNGAEVSFFKQPPEKLLLKKQRPVVGYFGAISEWFDMDLVVKAAQTYPDWDFVMVGSTFMGEVSAAKKIPNIIFTGEVPYKDLTGYLYAFDVCLIPFKITELTLCTNPVKVYEYLSAGKPVVSTALPEVEMISDQVHVATTTEEFLSCLQKAMVESKDPLLAEKRSTWAENHSWEKRVEILEAEIDNCYPLVSIIVLTYNNLSFTKACLDSLNKFTDYPNWELILVDNASTDETPEYLNNYTKLHENTRAILNSENLGFAAGNNVGLKAAHGEYLVLLNNDTYVTRGWLNDLIRHLRKDSSLGLVGPVTNNIGNEAKVNITYADINFMAEAARSYTSKHPRERLIVENLGFFCVAMSRQIFDRIGLLDEDFNRGFFEDDDYCNRVRQAGYSLAVAEDVFVHHHLSASFGKLEDPVRRDLFAKNKAIYEKKWGQWKPHSYREGVY